LNEAEAGVPVAEFMAQTQAEVEISLKHDGNFSVPQIDFPIP